MSKHILTIFLPVFVIGALQLVGCTQKQLGAAPPGGAYLSDSAGARFDQSVNVVDDSGKTVSYISTVPIRSIYRTQQDPALIYLTTGGSGVFVSNDGGRSWKALPIPLTSVTAFVHLKNGTWLASGTNENNEGIVIRSLDSGKSWQKVLTVPAAPKPVSKPFEIIKPKQPPPIVVSSIVVDNFHPDQVYATTNTGDVLAGKDSGKVWQTLAHVEGKKNAFTGESTLTISRILPSLHKDKEILLVSAQGGLIRYDGEKTQDLTLPAGNIVDVSFVQQFPDAIFISTTAGYFISRNTGIDWVKLNVPVSGAAPLRNALVRVSPDNPSRMIVTANSILFRSEDGGQSWNTLSLELPTYVITDISIDPSNPARVLLTTAPAQS